MTCAQHMLSCSTLLKRMQREGWYETRALGCAYAWSYAAVKSFYSEATCSVTWLGDLPTSPLFCQMVGLETPRDEVSQATGEVAVNAGFLILVLRPSLANHKSYSKWLLYC